MSGLDANGREQMVEYRTVAAAIAAGASAVLIAGPTASGKSALARAIASDHRGVIINADSIQVYAELRVLTARPMPREEAALPHRLYGHIAASTRYSVGRWLADLAGALAEAREGGMLPLVVGGTGLYFKALTEGLTSIPPIPADVRERLRMDSESRSSEELHAGLAAADPEDAGVVRPSDRSRILRALEVFAATGQSLAAWRRGTKAAPLVDGSAYRVVLDPDRAALHARISERTERMIGEGAEDEVRALVALGLDPHLPAMKAIGVRELIDHFAGKTSLDEALAAIKTETRRYAKRQMTWFRNQMRDWQRLPIAAGTGRYG